MMNKKMSGDYMSEYEKNEARKLAEMKFSPSYDMSKVITENGDTFLELESIYHYYEFGSGFQRDNLDDLRNSRNFSLIVKNEIKEDKGGDDDKYNNSQLPSLPKLLLLPSKSNKIVLFIPFSELIYICRLDD